MNQICLRGRHSENDLRACLYSYKQYRKSDIKNANFYRKDIWRLWPNKLDQKESRILKFLQFFANVKTAAMCIIFNAAKNPVSHG